MKIQQRTIKGTPDILMCLKGRFVAIELKTEDGVVSILQQHNLKIIKQSGGLSYVLTPENEDEVINELRNL